jgi:3-methylcrotonyl-CoA carboxylase alpha subunit
MIKKLLIANRGEIACRIIRTAHRLGVATVAVYSQADRGALHALLADQALPLNGSTATESYLDIEQILVAAKRSGADAIHPGYGFLSENSDFARAVRDAGLCFVGPDASAIDAMGSKSHAKLLMAKAGVPMLSGYHEADQDPSMLLAEANKIGWPVLIKAVAGGGGRGLRIVEAAEAFDEALQAVQREARAAFGDNKVLLEKYLAHARHVEIQVFADKHGNCVHLFERDCSLQRRHQKLIEEAPAPGLSNEVRIAMGEAAVRAAQSIQYTGAGTVEFLYQNGQFYFLEMNTRLQVEHPVTEAITGLDLVEWQLRVASGQPLPLQQAEISYRGWAIEARINAESGAPDFLPSTGLIQQLHWPAAYDNPGAGNEVRLRVDAGFRSGDRISTYYDNLLGKIIAWAPSRMQAAAGLSQALKQLHIAGISHNGNFLGAVLDNEAFLDGDVHTAFLSEHETGISAALIRRQQSSPYTAGTHWGALSAWRNGGSTSFTRQFHWSPLFSGGDPSPACRPETLLGSAAAAAAQQALKAPLPGRIISVMVNVGDPVKAGDALLIMEAMKMEHTLRASADVEVASLHCATDDMVQPDQLLMEFTSQ